MEREHWYRVWDANRQRMVYFTLDFLLAGYMNETHTGDLGFMDLNQRGQIKDIMDYTGLQDSNKKPIYEGDIVSVVHIHPVSGPYEERMRVIYAAYSWYLQIMEPDGRVRCDELMSYHGGSRLMVIGNIYENPELVK